MNPVRFYTLIYWRKFKKAFIAFLKGQRLIEAEIAYENAKEDVVWSWYRVAETGASIMRIKGVLKLLEEDGDAYLFNNPYTPGSKMDYSR